MNRFVGLALAVTLLAGTAVAVQPGRYQRGTLVNAVSGPPPQASMGASCYSLTIRVGDLGYVVEECPNFFWNGFAPHEFVEGGPVMVRMEGSKFCVLRPNGKELKARVVRRVVWQAIERQMPQRTEPQDDYMLLTQP